jgi:hypothetical protein
VRHFNIAKHRGAVWEAQRTLGLKMTPASSAPIVGCQYAAWVENTWWKRYVSLRPRVKAVESTARRLDVYLGGTPMSGLGTLLERVGRQHGVSPFFIVAVAGKESSLGTATCSANPRNVWGLGACGRAWSPPYFPTWEAAIDFFARFVNGQAGVGSGWPSARTPWDFGGYCRGCESSWASGVTRFMSAMGSSHNVRYP